MRQTQDLGCGILTRTAGFRPRGPGRPWACKPQGPKTRTRPHAAPVPAAANPADLHGAQQSGDSPPGADPFEPVKISTRSGRCTNLGLPAALVLILAATAPAEPRLVETFADDPLASERFYVPPDDSPSDEPRFLYQPADQSLLVRYRSGQPTLRLVRPLPRTLTDRDSFTLRARFRMIQPEFPAEYYAQVNFGLMNDATTGPNRNDDVPGAQDPALRGAFDVFTFDYTLSHDYPSLCAPVTASMPNPNYLGGYWDAMSFPYGSESLLWDEDLLPYRTLEAVVEYDGATRRAVLRVYDGPTALIINQIGADEETGGLDQDVTTIVTQVKAGSGPDESYPFRVNCIGFFSWQDEYSSVMGYASGIDVVFERIELTWTAFPDLTDDGAVDAADVERFEACQTGPAIPVEDPSCRDADLDLDGDVDQDDFGFLQRRLGTERRS